MQHELYGSLQQKTRLASLGLAVAKIQHDLRNILSSAQIASDRLAAIDDPVVKRVTPRLVDALDRAVALATNTLRYGRAEERTPQRTQFPLAPLIDEAAASAVPEDGEVALEKRVPRGLEIDADSEQLFRVMLNLLSNARQALEAMKADAKRPSALSSRLGGREMPSSWRSPTMGPAFLRRCASGCFSPSPAPQDRAARVWGLPSRAS